MTTPKDLASCNYVRIEIQLVIKHGCRKQRHDVQHAEHHAKHAADSVRYAKYSLKSGGRKEEQSQR